MHTLTDTLTRHFFVVLVAILVLALLTMLLLLHMHVDTMHLFAQSTEGILD